MARKVRFQYPVFTAQGFECFLQVEADVDFARPPLIRNGEAEDDGTDDEVQITSLMFLDEVSKGISVDAMPLQMISEIEEMAFEKAKEELENEYDYEFEDCETAY